jgi:hypothetical protein
MKGEQREHTWRMREDMGRLTGWVFASPWTKRKTPNRGRKGRGLQGG